jgi:hypothetical protein
MKRFVVLALALGLIAWAASEAAPPAISKRTLPGKLTAHGMLSAEVFTEGCATPRDLSAARARASGVDFADALFGRRAVPACHRLVSHLLPNLIVDTGEQYLVGAWLGTRTLSDMKYHGVGTSSVASAEPQTGCQAELTTEYTQDNVRATGTLLVGSSPNILQSVGANPLDGSPSTTVREWCLMSAAPVGTGIMWSRIVLPDTVVPQNGVIVTTYNLTIE